MIRSLEIKNIALISSLSLQFDAGMTVLSGETGSGKSIIIDALSFVLGERADKSLIKHGEESAVVEVVFEVAENGATAEAMEQLGLEKDGTVVISRSMNLSGRNECRVNGRICSASMLKTISSTLVDIFGQSQHINILKTENQREILDGFCHFDGKDAALSDAYRHYRQIKKQIASFGGTAEERERQMDILRYQITELENAKLSQEEEEELEAAHKRLVNIEKIATLLSQASEHIGGGEPNVLSHLASAHGALNSASPYDAEISALDDRLVSARLEIEDIAASVEQLLSQTEYDASKTDMTEARLEQIRKMKRKYGGSVAAALEFLQESKDRLQQLENASEIIEGLTAEREKTVKKMYDLSTALSAERRRTAGKLADSIKSQLQDLGMKGAEFLVAFADLPDETQCEKHISETGLDSLEFLFSANLGEPCKPLAKVISGGEMSRFMLAIKNVTAEVENKTVTMVFDEIDTGISGNIARMVAMKLANVSRDMQCIVITHLPQIAAIGDENLLIDKREENGRTVSSAHLLTEEEKCSEIARLMGGIGEHALVNAAEMLQWAREYKESL